LFLFSLLVWLLLFCVQAVSGVLVRAVRHRQSVLLTRLRAALSVESWAQLAPLTASSSGSSGSSGTTFDPRVHDVCVTGAWRSPFLELGEKQNFEKQQVLQQQQLQEHDEEEEELKSSHVEEGDEMVFEKDKQSNNHNNHNNHNGNNNDVNRLLCCSAGRVVAVHVEEDVSLLEVLPELAVSQLLKSSHTTWRYLLLSVWSFFVEGAQMSVSEGLARLLQQAKQTFGTNNSEQVRMLLFNCVVYCFVACLSECCC
jgi:hypothetical protein